MSALKRGTYIRESDGACHMYHSEITSWNFPSTALREFLAGNRPAEIHSWRMVTDENELESVKKFLCGNLKPGEYVEVDSYLAENFNNWENNN